MHVSFLHDISTEPKCPKGDWNTYRTVRQAWTTHRHTLMVYISPRTQAKSSTHIALNLPYRLLSPFSPSSEELSITSAHSGCRLACSTPNKKSRKHHKRSKLHHPCPPFIFTQLLNRINKFSIFPTLMSFCFYSKLHSHWVKQCVCVISYLSKKKKPHDDFIRYLRSFTWIHIILVNL